MTRLDDLLQFDGISRTVLEARIKQLVAKARAVESVFVRIEGRIGNAERTMTTHPDDAVRTNNEVRAAAYLTVLEDLREALSPDE